MSSRYDEHGQHELPPRPRRHALRRLSRPRRVRALAESPYLMCPFLSLTFCCCSSESHVALQQGNPGKGDPSGHGFHAD